VPPQTAHAAPLARQRVASARRRLWVQHALRRGAGVGLLTAGLIALLSILLRMDVLSKAWDRPLALVAAAYGLGAIVWILMHRIGALATAQKLDRLGDCNDGLSTALWLAEQGRVDGWAQVQARTAETAAARLDVAALLPWRLPAKARWWPVAAALALLALFAPLGWLLQWTAPGGRRQPLAGLIVPLPPGPTGFPTAAAMLGADAVDLVHTDLRLLGELEAQVHRPETRRWLLAVRDVLAKVADGRVDKRQAMEMLADLETRRPSDAAAPDAPQQPGEPARDPAEAEQQRDLAVRNAVLDAARAAADAAPKGAEADAIKKATDQKDLDALARIAEKLAEKNLSDKELDKWIKAVEKFASALKDQKVPDKFKSLAERIARLQQKRSNEGGLTQSDQERLQSARHELEQLRRSEGDRQAAQHQVERLERGARAAADELRRQQQSNRLGSKGAQNKEQTAQTLKNQMRAAADELRREHDSEQDRQAERIGQARMRDVREALEKSGGRNAARESFEQRAAGHQGQKQSGNDEKSRLGPKPPAAGEAEQASPNQGRQPQQDQGKAFKLGQGRLGNRSRMEELRREAAQAGRGAETGQHEPGGGQGDGPGDDAHNAKDQRLAGGKREKLQGQEGQGPDTKKVFVDAARKGFARQGWRQVYVDYSEVAEEMLDKEQLPASRRATVRRYFELIRPR